MQNPHCMVEKLMESVVDERGRILIPRQIRENLGLERGTVVELEQEGKTVVLRLARKRGSSWRDLADTKPARTGKPKWPIHRKKSNVSGNRY